VDAKTGKLLWKKDDADTREIMPTAMAVSGDQVFFQNEKALVALDAANGRELWRAARPVNLDAPGSSAPTLVASGDVVIVRIVKWGQPHGTRTSRAARRVGIFSHIRPTLATARRSPMTPPRVNGSGA